jgi:hemerythrin-like metal-binding protein
MKAKRQFEKLVWDDSYSSGLIYLDNHRHNFLDILNELVEVVNDESCGTTLPMIFHRLAFYAEDFFTKKEMAMASIEEIDTNIYRAEHDRLTQAVARFHDDFRAGQMGVCAEMLIFLVEWFENYVRIFGPDVAEHLRKKGYE